MPFGVEGGKFLSRYILRMRFTTIPGQSCIVPFYLQINTNVFAYSAQLSLIFVWFYCFIHSSFHFYIYVHIYFYIRSLFFRLVFLLSALVLFYYFFFLNNHGWSVGNLDLRLPLKKDGELFFCPILLTMSFHWKRNLTAVIILVRALQDRR